MDKRQFLTAAAALAATPAFGQAQAKKPGTHAALAAAQLVQPR